MHDSTAFVRANNPRLKFEHDLRGWISVTISPVCRNPQEYVDHVRSALRCGSTVPHPRGDAELAALQEAFPEVAEMFADSAVSQ